MAPRPAWKGYLKLSLVTCAVELTNAVTHAEKISFHVLNRATGNPVKRQYVDAASGKPVTDDDEVKGYPLGGDKYLLIEEEDIDKVQIESSHTLALESFVRKDTIEQVYLDQPYYLSPADKVSTEAFAVIREALADKKMAGLARIVLFRRERPVVIEPLGKGMLLTTLRYASTVRSAETIFDEIGNAKIDKKMIDLGSDIIDKKKGKFDPSKFEDRYEEALAELVEAKRAGRKPPRAKPAPKPSNVVNLFDALKKSLAGDDRDGKKTDKAPARRAAAKEPARRKAEPRKAATERKRKSA
jgi:DNA end-binding protein Ku